MRKFTTLAIAAAVAAAASAGANAYEAGDIIIRAGAVTVAPDVDSDKVVLPTSPETVFPGVDVDNDTQLSIIGAYMLDANWGIELLAATPFKHNIDLDGANIDAGSTKHLPPTLSVQWYPRGDQQGWQPYFGLGVNYTYFFDEDTDGQLDGALTALLGSSRSDLDLDDSWGLAVQAGVDFPITEQLSLNAGVWWIDIDTDATVKTDVGNVKFDVELDPWVYNIGIAWHF